MVLGVPEGSTTSTSGPVVLTPSTVPTTAPSEPPPDDVFGAEGKEPRSQAEPRASTGLAPPDGQPWPEPLAFTTSETVPEGLVFILVAGSDARPGEDLLHSRADAIHLLAVNPATGAGTLLGFPRDSWVEIPGRGRGKINNALVLGGPDLLAATVRRLTGLPVDYYVITGFPGLTRMVDELGGLDVFVDRRMNDRVSGAHFERGWHHFSGGEALAFSRNRNDVKMGDFSRSEHQGLLLLSALAKLRGDVADDAGVARWTGILLRHVRLSIPPARLPALAALARSLDPGSLRNIIAPGRIGMAGGQSVVFLTTGAARLFADLRADAVVGGAPPDPSITTTSTTATTVPAEPSQPTEPTQPESTTSTTSAGEDTTTSTLPTPPITTQPAHRRARPEGGGRSR